MAHVSNCGGPHTNRNGSRAIEDDDAVEIEVSAVVAHKDPVATGFVERLDSTKHPQRASDP